MMLRGRYSGSYTVRKTIGSDTLVETIQTITIMVDECLVRKAFAVLMLRLHHDSDLVQNMDGFSLKIISEYTSIL